MKFEIDHETVLASVNEALELYDRFGTNIEQHLSMMRKAEDEESAVCIAKSISYNRRMMAVYLERAAAVLELIGVFHSETDCIDYETIREKAEEIKKTAKANE